MILLCMARKNEEIEMAEVVKKHEYRGREVSHKCEDEASGDMEYE